MFFYYWLYCPENVCWNSGILEFMMSQRAIIFVQTVNRELNMLFS